MTYTAYIAQINPLSKNDRKSLKYNVEELKSFFEHNELFLEKIYYSSESARVTAEVLVKEKISEISVSDLEIAEENIILITSCKRVRDLLYQILKTFNKEGDDLLKIVPGEIVCLVQSEEKKRAFFFFSYLEKRGCCYVFKRLNMISIIPLY